jgi:hypothetical protein
MEHWSHHVEWFGPNVELDTIRESLDDLSKHGYEFVSVVPHTRDGIGSGLVAISRRLALDASHVERESGF